MALCSFFGVALAFSIRQKGFSASSIVSIVLLLIIGSFSFYSYFFRFSVKRKAKADLVYGVTNHRRVLIRDNSTRRILTFDASLLENVSITELNKNGVGTIYLRKKGFGSLLDNTGLDFLGNGKGYSSALFDVDDCEEVYRLIVGEEE